MDYIIETTGTLRALSMDIVRHIVHATLREKPNKM